MSVVSSMAAQILVQYVILSLKSVSKEFIDLNTFDTDDCYTKFQMNDVSYRSEIKHKEPQYTDLNMSSVDSAALSPTYSSTSHLNSFNNWGDMNMKKEDIVHATTIEDIAKLSLQSHETSCDTDRSSSLTADLTPIGQLNFQLNLGNINFANNTACQGNASAILSAKHVASSFAIHAMKSNPVKAQSDKSAQKERRFPDFYLKDCDLSKRSSIERNLEHAQNLAQSLLQQNASQNQLQNSVSLASQNVSNTQPTQPQLHTETEKKEKEPELEMKKDIMREKLVINTNLLSPSEKSTTISQMSHDSATLRKAQQKPQLSDQKDSDNAGRGSSTPTNLGPRQDASNLASTAQSNSGQTSLSQPNSATYNRSIPNSISTPNFASMANNTASQESAIPNPNAQNLTLLPQTSAGCIQSKPAAPTSGFYTGRHLRNSLSLQIGPQGTEVSSTTSALKHDDISQSTHLKLQSTTLFDKIKVRLFI